MTGPATLSEPSPAAQWAALLAVPALCAVVAFVFHPRPTGVEEARERVDRSELSDIIADEAPAEEAKGGPQLGESIELVGTALPDEPLSRGERFSVKTRWKVLRPMDRKWKMFVHIDLQNGRHRIHGDHWPTGDRYPTTLWQQDEVVVDPWRHRIPLDAPKGTYDIYLGYYIDDERMRFTGGSRKLHAGENRLRVGSLTVK